MLEFKFLLLFVAITASTGREDALTEIYKDMGIIPTYMKKPPDEYLKVVYDQNVAVENGMEIRPIQTKEPPLIEWLIARRTYYTIIMTCADAPQRANPYLREWLQWLVVNIPGSEWEYGDTICPHISMLPPKNGGLLRHVIFIFEQIEYMIFDELHINATNQEGHAHFDTMKFAKKYNMGHPLASVTFQAQWDDYAQVIRDQLKIVDT